MEKLSPRAAVIDPQAAALRYLPGCRTACRVTVDRDSLDCRYLEQRIFTCATGKSSLLGNAASEDILYVVSGSGAIEIDGRNWPLQPGTAALVCMGQTYAFRNPHAEPLVVISVLAPQPAHARELPATADVPPLASPCLQAAQIEAVPASPERCFKVLIDPHFGARHVTQFLGIIEKSRAEDHSHPYEEVIYILAGKGIAHINGSSHPIVPGSSVYLPIGAQHCLENPYDEPLQLLGVFCPAGSPANRTD